MDKWTEDQYRKMKLGGNSEYQRFVKAYGDGGGFRPGMKIQEKYFCHASMQYKEKVRPNQPTDCLS